MFKNLTLFSILPAIFFSGCSLLSGNNEESISSKSIAENTTPQKTAKQTPFSQTEQPKKGDTIAIIQTSMGTVKLKLFTKEVPKTTENFIGLAKKGYYNGIVFHRVIPNFMIQGGDPTGTGRGGESLWGGKFEDEFDPQLKNVRGAISMANAGPNTNGSQFFLIQTGATPWLDGKHSVFGQTFEGVENIDAIAQVEADANDKPLTPVTIENITITKY